MDELEEKELFDRPDNPEHNENPEIGFNNYGRKLYLSDDNRIALGLCGGLSDYFLIEPVIFRIIFLFGVFLAGAGIIVYFVMGLIIQRQPEKKPVDPAKAVQLIYSNNISIFSGIIFLLGIYVIFNYAGYFALLEYRGFPARIIVFLVEGTILFLLFSFSSVPKSETSYKESFHRSRSGALIGGVCSGFADYIGSSVITVRIVWCVLSIAAFGIPALIYLLFLIRIPVEEAT